MKVGDGVRIRRRGIYHCFLAGDVGKIISYRGCPYWEVAVGSISQSIRGEDLELITNEGGKMSVWEKFKLNFLGEPEKTYRKLGITNGDNMPTEDGVKMVIAHLLTDGGISNSFFTKVAKPMLEEQEKDTK